MARRSSESVDAATSPRPFRRLHLHQLTVVVVVVALLLTAFLVVTMRIVRDNNENRLLRQRSHEAATLAASNIQGLQAPLAGAVALADSTAGSPDAFSKLMAPIVAAGQPFSSASLWRVGDPTPLLVVGEAPRLAAESPEVRLAAVQNAAARLGLSLRSMLADDDRRLGYAFGDGSTYVAYGEARLPHGRKARIAKDSAFADLDYALYLGRRAVAADLIASSSGRGIPEHARQAASVVPFGDSSVLIVVSPRGVLGGTVLGWLPWVLLGLGIAGAVLAGWLTEFLVRRREHAERLAADLEASVELTEALYREQRYVAETLQRSLMPRVVPSVAGLETAGRYEAGVVGTEVGGDWYDVVPLAPRCLLFSVGDVSGRGLEAAATMASLRYAIRAYALEGSDPAEVLQKLTTVLSIARSGLFATVICGMVDGEHSTVTVARAGHPDLLMITDDGARFLGAPNGPAIGLVDECEYESVKVALTPVTTMVAFTDGLVERRGETLDDGLERLRSVSHRSGTLPELVADLVAELAPGSADDVAVLGLRWTGGIDEEHARVVDARVP